MDSAMTENNYIYAPSEHLADKFRCKVPMKGTRQLFVIDGGVQGTDAPLSIKYERGQSSEEILQVIGVRTSSGPRELDSHSSYYFEQSTQGKLILCSHTFAEDPFVTREKVKITLEANASVDIVLMQNEHNDAEHISDFEINLERDASLRMVFLTLHGGKITNNINVNLNGENASCDLNGLYIVDGSQQVKNVICMNHKVPHCLSSQLFKGILDDSSVASFSGLIHVWPDAQKTEAYQENHNLLLTKNAKIYSEPQLEIYADDVKCSHGATNGSLDENELFYLRSRGIPYKEAQLLQQQAFAFAVLDKISTEELKERMISLTEQRLRGEFSKCKNCCKNCC
jgi:Fe-S cluster assembly protein SufD